MAPAAWGTWQKVMATSTRVKICGITSLEDAEAAVAAGADALGFVFYEPSPRYIDVDEAGRICRQLGPFVTLVGLFVNAPEDVVRETLDQVPLHLLQFHGDEGRKYCEQFGRPYLKALRMKPGLDVHAAIDSYPSAAGILLDAYRKGVPGGTGESFDWQRVPRRAARPIVLAGGLNPDNVSQAIAQTAPYGVDVSGGVEAAPGRKDFEKVVAFITNAKSGD